jgi:TPR repeat protein
MSGEHHGDGQASDSERHRFTHQSSTSTTWTRAAFAAVVLLLTLAAPVVAGPVEDATAAYGRGDYATALRLFRPLADQGDAYAQAVLGRLYFYGHGVPQDHAEASKWYRLAADQGHADAQRRLGSMYRFAGWDRGGQYYVNAHMWFNLAAAQGDQDAAKDRDDVAKLMTPAQIAEAQKLAREWQPKRP